MVEDEPGVGRVDLFWKVTRVENTDSGPQKQAVLPYAGELGLERGLGPSQVATCLSLRAFAAGRQLVPLPSR